MSFMKWYIIPLILLIQVAEASHQRACLEALCGPEESFENYADLFNKNFHSQMKDSEFEKKMQDKLTKLADQEIASWNKRYETLERLQQNPELLQTELPVGLVKSVSLLTILLGDFNLLYTSEAVTSLDYFNLALILFYEDKAREALKDKYSANDLEWVLRLHKQFYNSERHSRLIRYALTSSNLPQYIFNSHLNNDAISIFQALHTELSQAHEKLKLILSSGLDNVERALLNGFEKKILHWASLTEYPDFILEKINSDLFFVDILFGMMTNAPDDFFQVVREMPQSLINQYEQRLTSLDPEDFNPLSVNAETIQKRKREVIQACIANVRSLINISPDKAQLSHIREEFKLFKQNTTTFLTKNFGRDLSRYINQKMGLLQFDLPPSQEFIKGHVLNLLDSDSENDDEMMLMSLLLNSSMTDDESAFELDFSDICAPFEAESHLDDKILASDLRPLLKVSPITAKNFQKLKSTMAHELGHYVYHLLKGRTHDETRDFDPAPRVLQAIEEKLSCVSSAHPNASLNDFEIKHDEIHSFKVGQFTSEDFADHFSTMISPSKSHNGECHLIYRIEDGSLHLSLETEVSAVHSPSLYRAMLSHKQNHGELPLACETLLKEESQSNIPTCFER